MSRGRLPVAVVVLVWAVGSFADKVRGPGQPLETVSPAWLQYRQGLTSVEQGKLDEAEAAFRKSLEQDPNQVGALVGLGELALRRSRPQVAEDYLKQALKRAPNNAGVQVAWGRYLAFQNRAAEAETAFKKAVAADSNLVAARVDLGDLYMTAFRKPKQAVGSYREALVLHPLDARVRYRLGLALAELGEFDAAVTELERAGRDAPGNPLPYQALGRLYAARGQSEKALQSFALATKAQPGYVGAYLGRGDLYMTQGKTALALAEYTKALGLAPDFAFTHLKLALFHEAGGRFEDAEKAYLTAVRLEPRLAVAYNNLAWMAGERKVKLDQALGWAKKAVELAPGNVDFRDTLGWVYRARGEYAKAIPVLKEPAASRPPRADLLYHLGVVLAEAGNAAEAKTALNQALALAKDFPGADDARRRLQALGR